MVIYFRPQFTLLHMPLRFMVSTKIYDVILMSLHL